MKKFLFILSMLSSIVCLSCTNKRQHSQPGTTPDKESALIRGSDTVTNIQAVAADKDIIIYDTPECYLWYVEDLPDKYKEKPVSMWTEHPAYRENVQVINVFVINPTSAPLMYGRGWILEQWNGKEWVTAKTKSNRFWFDDGFNKQKAPLLYCFRFPVSRYYHLPKGRYRICKSFSVERENIELNAEFEIKL